MVAFEVFTVLKTAITLSLALAHALEFPGKLRLDEQTYAAVQRIYYPGFTVVGGAEPIAAIATLVLFLTMRHRSPQFWLLLTAFTALTAMHGLFWVVTQPTNRYWLKDQKLSKAGTKFFNIKGIETRKEISKTDWKYLRARWSIRMLCEPRWRASRLLQ
jgi:hypothetical protein